jgi:hypothetical protein
MKGVLEMPSYETYVKIFNHTDSNITLKITEVSSYDWDGNSRPDKNLNGRVIAAGGMLREREEINRFAKNCMYRLTILFPDGGSMDTRIDQKYAREWLHTYTGYYFSPATRKIYALKYRPSRDESKNTLNVYVIQRGKLPTTRAKFHAGVYPVIKPVHNPDHTYVLAEDGGQKINFPCWGGVDWDRQSISNITGDLELAIAIACHDPFDRRITYDDLAHNFLPSDSCTYFGDSSGLLYAFGGVCHQMANRILFALDPFIDDKGNKVYYIVNFAGGYNVSYWAYGVYGKKTNFTTPWESYLTDCLNWVAVGRYINDGAELETVTPEQVKKELLRRTEFMDPFSRESIRLEIEHADDENLPDLRLKLLIDTAFPQGYDDEKIKAIIEKDTALRNKSLDIPQPMEGEAPTKQNMLDYADSANRAFSERLQNIHSIVGDADFAKIFGIEFSADYALIDKNFIDSTLM